MVTAASPSPVYTPALYYVRSDSNPALFYTIAQADGRCTCGQQISGLLHCSCPDHIHRARDCKHVKRVITGQVKAAQVKAPTRRFTTEEVNRDLYGVAS